MTETTAWTISVSAETDATVRQYLAETGRDSEDVSAFVEEAVRWRLFDRTLADVRSRFTDLAPEALEDLVSEAVTAARSP